MTIWSLPRPASFVDDIEYTIRDGSNIVVRFPCSVPVGLERELRERLQAVCGAWTSIDASCAGADPVALLRERVCPGVTALKVRGMADLADTASFQGRLLWIEKIGRSDWAQWAAALAAYADACRSVDLMNRTLFIVVLSGGVVAEDIPEEVALVRRDFRNVVDTTELFMFALCKLPDSIERLEHRALVAHIVSQLARWDCLLAEQLLSASLDEALSPYDVLRDYACGRGWTSHTSRCWENGTVDGPDDRPIVHSALLTVSGESRSVSQRIWAGQAAVLLPLVEERRIGLIPRCRRYLKLPIENQVGQWVHDPLDLEVGPLAWNIDRTDAPQGLKKRVRWLRDVRNNLAHMEPLQPDEALRLCYC